MDKKKAINELLAETEDALSKTFSSNNQLDFIENVSNLLIDTLKNGNKILICGNGGSAADSQHFAAEIVGRYKLERKSYPAIALTTDTSILTAIGNDYGYQQVFARQVEGLGCVGDVLIAISTSGNSSNIIKAVEVAKNMDIKTVGLTGISGGKLIELTDYHFSALSNNTPHIQTSHIIALHTICEIVEKFL